MFNEALSGSKEPEAYITDCTIDTDMELLIPDSYISLTSEKIRLYKELDNITTEEGLVKFTEELRDRFGELPPQLMQLTYVVRLRREAIKLGFERIVLKNNMMLVYFVSNQQSPYYSTPVFASILNYINSSPKNMSVTEQN
jgi:transcription-repair coupling factor (superfamily II helicase)